MSAMQRWPRRKWVEYHGELQFFLFIFLGALMPAPGSLITN